MCRKLIFCILCFALVFPITANAQSSNPCGVKAVLVPGNDSIITVPTGVSFTSASINATDYRLIFEPYQYPMNTPVTTGFGKGLTTVKLVAYNGACTDTAVAYYFYAGDFPAVTDNPRKLYGFGERDHEITGLISSGTGGYLLAGDKLSPWIYNEPQVAILVKTKQEGCVEWGRKVAGKISSTIHMIKEAAGGGFYVLADIDWKLFLAKLDANGNVQWAETFTWPDATHLLSNGIEPTPDGGVVVMGNKYSNYNNVLLRLNSNGGILWQKEFGFTQNGSQGFNNMAIKDNFLYIAGNASSNANYYGLLTKMDFNTGQFKWTKTFSQPNGAMALRDIISVDSTLLVNIGASTGLNNVPSFGGLMRLDTAGQVLSASVLGETYTPNYLVGPYNAGSTHLIRSGKTFYMLSAGSYSLSLQPGISYYTKLVKYDSTYQVQWVQSSGGAGVPRFFFNALAPFDGFAIAGEEVGSALNANGLGWLLSLKTIDSSGGNPSANCYFGKQAFVTAQVPVTTQPVQWNVDIPATITAGTLADPLLPFYPEMRFKCPDYVDSCSYLKITGQKDVCNLSANYTYQTHKNKACGQPTQWTVPANVQTISQSGSSVTVHFPAFGRYVIYGTNPLSCIPVQDSIVIIAGSKTPPLDLGPDQQICPQNTVTLHAGKKFFTYEWQDGSTDSLLQASQPGKYWVKVTDSCSNELSDTVYITLAPPIPFSVGADRTKCDNDTIRLQAPTGFLNYSWSPAYNISGAGSQVAIVDPQVDTVYTIMAEKTPGCFAYDTVNILVYHSIAINLGRDTSVCKGDSVVLDAGPGLQQYQWSNGAATQKLTVFASNSYSVIGTTNEGCKSGDTIRIVVNNNPDVELGNDNTLCAGSTRILQAGNFAAYKWQNGDTGPSFTVTGLGKYYVTVTDNNRCQDSDTLNIDQLLAAPAKFLPADTILCAYAKLELKPARTFAKYLWSNGAISPAITVSPTGLYWLQATDEHNCTGIDTMVIQPKDCLTGLYVPTAFTPNHDGRNDVFKPVLLGYIKAYEFSIYNRWGQRLFYSTDPNKGWDGLNGGTRQDTNVFVWVCKYQLDGEEVKVGRGTVALIR